MFDSYERGESIFAPNPESYAYYAAMMAKNRRHIFNYINAYNPFVTDQDGYNIEGNVQYLNNPFAMHKFGYEDIFMHRLIGKRRALGLNNYQAELAASQSYELTKMNAGISFGSAAAQVASIFVNPFIGIPASIGIGFASDRFSKNMEKIYAQNQKVNILTANMLSEGGTDLGLSSGEIKDISKHIRKLAVHDTMFSANDIQDMMLKLNKIGFLNDINSAAEFKKAVRNIKDRVKDLAEFLGETNPSKLLQSLAMYKHLGFTRAQSFDIMKSVKIASDISGINQREIEGIIGASISGSNLVDKRVATKQLISELYKTNFATRGDFRSTYLTNRKEFVANLQQANQSSEIALDKYFNSGTNKTIYLAAKYAQEKGIPLQEAYETVSKMDHGQYTQLITKYSKTDKDFGKVFYTPSLLQTAVQEIKEVGNLKMTRSPLQRIIDKIIRQLGDKANITNVMWQLQNYTGMTPSQLSASKPYVEARLETGSFDVFDKTVSRAEKQKQLTSYINKSILMSEKTGLYHRIGTALRGVSEWAVETFGGFLGDEAFDKIKEQEKQFTVPGEVSNRYLLYKNMKHLYKITGAKSPRDVFKYISDFYRKREHKRLSNYEIKMGMEKYARKGEGTALERLIGEDDTRYVYKKSWLEQNVIDSAQYWGYRLELESQRDIDHSSGLRGIADWALGPLANLRGAEKRRYLSNHPELSRFIERGTHKGRYQAEMAISFMKDMGIGATDKLEKKEREELFKKMRTANLYYDYMVSGKKESFFEYAEKAGYIPENIDIAKMEPVYKNLINKVLKGDRTKENIRKIESGLALYHEFKKSNTGVSFSEFAKDKGLHLSEDDARAILDIAKKNESIPEYAYIKQEYEKAVKSGYSGDMTQFLKSRQISIDSRTTQSIKKMYEKIGSIEKQKQTIIKDILLHGSRGDIEEVLKKDLMHSDISPEWVESIIDKSFSGSKADELKKIVYNEAVAKVAQLRKTKKGRETLAAAEDISEVINKLPEEEREKIAKSLEYLDHSLTSQKFFDVVKGLHIKESQKTKILEKAIEARKYAKENHLSVKELYDIGISSRRKTFQKTADSILGLLGVQGIDDKKKAEIFEKLAKGKDLEALRDINKIRIESGKGTLSLRELRSIENIGARSQKLGFGKEDTERMAALMKSGSSFGESALVIINKKNGETLNKIAENTDPVRLSRKIAEAING